MKRSWVLAAHLLVAGLLVLAVVGCSGADSSTSPSPDAHAPNILFVIMDDLGIDQMDTFGYGGANPAVTPNLDALANAGVRFRNVWAMPECTPSRAMFFEGRYPFRTNILNALVSDDLANSQLSPFEVATPKLLAQHGYSNGYFGKFHLAGPHNNPFVNGTPLGARLGLFLRFRGRLALSG